MTQAHILYTERPITDGADIHVITNYRFPVAFYFVGLKFRLLPLSSDKLNQCSALREKVTLMFILF